MTVFKAFWLTLLTNLLISVIGAPQNMNSNGSHQNSGNSGSSSSHGQNQNQNDSELNGSGDDSGSSGNSNGQWPIYGGVYPPNNYMWGNFQGGANWVPPNGNQAVGGGSQTGGYYPLRGSGFQSGGFYGFPPAIWGGGNGYPVRGNGYRPSGNGYYSGMNGNYGGGGGGGGGGSGLDSTRGGNLPWSGSGSINPSYPQQWDSSDYGGSWYNSNRGSYAPGYPWQYPPNTNG